MSSPQVLLSDGPDGLRAAALLSVRGTPVRLLQSGNTPSGLSDASRPVDPPRFSVAAAVAEDLETALGPLEPAPVPRRGLSTSSGTVALPCGLRTLLGTVDRGSVTELVREYSRTRGRNGLAELVGGGQEERSHRDWVVRRMGAPLWRSLYEPYIQARDGASSSALSSVRARVLHAAPSSTRGVVLADASGWEARALRAIRAAGGEVVTGAKVSRVEVEAGSVSRVHLADGSAVDLDGTLWSTVGPRRMANWLAEALPRTLAVDASRLPSRTAVRVFLQGELQALDGQEVDEVHIVDQSFPLWRVVRCGEGVVASLTLPEGASFTDDVLLAECALRLEQRGLARVDASSGRVERLRDWQPVWVRNAHAVLRPVLVGWSGLGIRSIGRAGTHAPLDVGEEASVVERLAASTVPDLQEVQRQVVFAPARLDDLWCSPGAFVGR